MVVLKGLMELVVCHGLFIVGPCQGQERGYNQGETNLHYGVGVGVTNRIRGQGKNIVRNYLTMWTSVGGS